MSRCVELCCSVFFFFKQKTAYEMRISDWSSDVCSSDLAGPMGGYSATDFAAYFLIVFLVRQMTAAWVYEELDREIRHGEMSPRLLRPFDPYWQIGRASCRERVFQNV